MHVQYYNTRLFVKREKKRRERKKKENFLKRDIQQQPPSNSEIYRPIFQKMKVSLQQIIKVAAIGCLVSWCVLLVLVVSSPSAYEQWWLNLAMIG